MGDAMRFSQKKIDVRNKSWWHQHSTTSSLSLCAWISYLWPRKGDRDVVWDKRLRFLVAIEHSPYWSSTQRLRKKKKKSKSFPSQKTDIPEMHRILLVILMKLNKVDLKKVKLWFTDELEGEVRVEHMTCIIPTLPSLPGQLETRRSSSCAHDTSWIGYGIQFVSKCFTC